jgi:hypothetical protein
LPIAPRTIRHHSRSPVPLSPAAAPGALDEGRVVLGQRTPHADVPLVAEVGQLVHRADCRRVQGGTGGRGGQPAERPIVGAAYPGARLALAPGVDPYQRLVVPGHLPDAHLARLAQRLDPAGGHLGQPARRRQLAVGRERPVRPPPDWYLRPVSGCMLGQATAYR